MNSEQPVAVQIAQEILQAKPDLGMSIEDLVSTLGKVVDDTDGLGSFPAYRALVCNAVMSGYNGDCVAIGHLDAHGLYVPCNHHGRTVHPTGDDVQMRIVRSSCGGGLFTELVEVYGNEHVAKGFGETNCDTLWGPNAQHQSSCNIWVHFGCWSLFHNWLDCPLSPRIGRGGKPLTLFGELYEVVGSRYERQKHARGWLPCIDYGGTLDAYMVSQYQDYILGPRKGVAHILQALEKGLRGESLIPAILEDCRFWMFLRPDDWPRAPQAGSHDHDGSTLTWNAIPQPQAAICHLPNELWPGLLQHFHLEDVFSLASTCKDLHTRILDPGTLRHVVRHAMDNVSSPLHWIVPVRTGLRAEWLAACDAMKTWLPGAANPPPPTFMQMEFAEDDLDDDEDYCPPASGTESTDEGDDGADDDGEDEAETDVDEGIIAGNITDVPAPPPSEYANDPLPPLPMFDADFPLLPFLRAYRHSDSMRARRRQWEIIKQFDVLFTNYRRDGWERGDDFLSREIPWALDDNGTYRCQCEASQPK
ncbi:hypothetical protein C8Q70DRAFT_1054199 [Cubamyces menziesii]|nr:hypothetical protein C8Q70DRAFT_1054199 [Cubamyces menziesii]